MGFVYRSDRKSYLDEVIDPNLPGPGSYLNREKYDTKCSDVAFLCSEERLKLPRQATEIPGPGAYNVFLELGKPKHSENIFAPSPKPKNFQSLKQHDVFKSASQKILGKNLRINDTPGPGSYNLDVSMGKKVKAFPRSDSLDKLKIIKYNSVPSIPSNIHNHGYVVNESQEATLVKNPLLEVHKDVGPGYYNIVPETSPAKAKGPRWHKSGAKRFSNSNKFSTPETVGPGSYDSIGDYASSYKSQISSGFASKSRRTFDEKINRKYTNDGANSLSGTQKADLTNSKLSEFEGAYSMQEYIENATPGPGYYYNESTASSFRQKTSPHQRQSFNNGIERFKDNHMNESTLGPGHYDSPKEIHPKKKGVPFTYTDARFEKMNGLRLPGPGTYDPKNSFEDVIEEKARVGQVSFGTTEKRFKFLTQSENVPGPGYYTKMLEEDLNKPLIMQASASFASNSKRELYDIRNEAPAPNTYDVSNFNIAKSTIPEEEDEQSELHPNRGTMSQSPRFKEFKKEPETVLTRAARYDHLKAKLALNDSLLGSKDTKPKFTAAFATTKRTDNLKSLDIPGPGAYHDSHLNPWNKRTFNVLFSEI